MTKENSFRGLAHSRLHSFFLAGRAARLCESSDPSSASPQSSAAPAPCTANCPQTPAKPATANPDSPAKPPAKAHKVYTNEDIDARPHDITIEGARDLLQQLNACDRTCFDQVAQRAGLNAGSGPR